MESIRLSRSRPELHRLSHASPRCRRRPRSTAWYCLLPVLYLCLAPAVFGFPAPDKMTDARLRAMGGAGVTTATGATATYSNPALLGLLNEYEFMTTLPVIVYPMGLGVSLREFGVVLPLWSSPAPHVTAAINYQKLHFTEDSESTALSLTAGIRTSPWLSAGLAVRRIGQSIDPDTFGTDGDASLAWDFGCLVHRELLRRGDRFVEGRLGLAYRNWGPELRLGESGGSSFNVPLSEEYALGLGLILAEPGARFTLSYEFSELADKQPYIPTERKYGVELELFELLSLRAGHADAERAVHNTQGVGIIMPFLNGFEGRFDYTANSGYPDLYAASLALDRAAPRPTTVLGLRVRARAGFCIGGAASRPGDTMFDPGPGLQVGALVQLTENIGLENHLGWTWLSMHGDPPVPDHNYTAMDFGTGVRHRFDFGNLSPFVVGGVRGYRLGYSVDDASGGGETRRWQTTAPGYYLGFGLVHRPENPAHPGSDIGIRVHSVRHRLYGTSTNVDISYAILFP